MKKTPTNAFTLYLQSKYDKANQRLERAMTSGRFAQFMQRKKAQLLNRLSRYARQLGIGMKQSLVAAGIAAGLLLCNPAQAQTFTEQTLTANPFDGVDVGATSAPTFVDIDNDGDKDAFIGESNGSIKYYKNTGTASSPIFTEQTLTANPFDGVDVGSNSTPTFVDIDNDGDKDAFIGSYAYGYIKYYKNTGTASSPAFTAQTGTANPFNGVTFGTCYSRPTFVDIDNDGDKDAFIGEYGGTINYYKNTGTVSSPTFTVQTGTDNPFNNVNVGYLANPTFVDIDNDGDQDAFIGAADGTIKYYQNTPAVLPVELLTFEGKNTEGGNRLTWQTASEVNNKGFDIERSRDGQDFQSIGTVKGIGKAANYNFVDANPYNGINYYRLKQMDFDGKETLSKVVTTSTTAKGTSKIKIFPTNTEGSISIDNGGLTIDNIAVYNHVGQLVLTNNGVNRLDLSALPSGLYLVQVKAGGETVTEKVFKR